MSSNWGTSRVRSRGNVFRRRLSVGKRWGLTGFGAIRGGAKGYLLKGSPAAEIAQAVRQVHAGESYLSPRIAAKLVGGIVQPGARARLSAREQGVLRLVAAGLSNRQIAETLSISERTVKFHVTAIFNKLGADNRAQAVAIAAERGLLSRS